MTDADLRALKWELRVAGGSQAVLELPPDQIELLRVAIPKTSGHPWDVQLNQSNLPATAGHRYRFEFRARSNQPRMVGVGLSQGHNPWEGLGFYQDVELTGVWRDFHFQFTAARTDENSRIHFDLGAVPVSVQLDAIALYREPGGLPVGPDFAVQGQYPAERWKTVPNTPAQASAGTMAPRFSIVIPTFQRRELALNAVRSFARQDFSAAFEVIVVVDGSRDGSAEALRNLAVPFNLTVIEQPNQGAATARNAGAAASKGEIILFLDDDMEPHPRMLAEHEYCYRAGAEVVLGHIPLHPESPPGFLSAGVKRWAEERGRRLSRPGAELTLDDLLTGQLSMPREIFRKAAGFDTNFTRGGTFGNEDLDLGHRLVGSGYRIVFHLYAISYQNYSVTPAHYLRQVRQTGRADVEFARKHPELAGMRFASRPRRALSPEVWRFLTRFSPVLAPFMNTARTVARAKVEKTSPSSRAVNFFFEICEMEYWRGVHEAGGMPAPRGVRVLAYHPIQDLAGEPVLEQYGVPPAQFRSQMRLLIRCGFHFLSGDQFLAFLKHGGELPPRAVLVTFDDCYEDLREAALPILRDLRIPAIAFAVSNRLGGSNTWDRDKTTRSLPLLNGEGLTAVAGQGIEIGAHSRTHCDLSRANLAEIEDEVVGSADELAAAGIARPRWFAYPYGAWNAPARRAAQRAGFEGAFTIEPGLARKGMDRYGIPRIEIYRRNKGWRFLWRVVTA